ncbi:MAG TPA: nucleotide disphospho-sugar-binding domain-containing protein [Gammaproteobacteria bacterium]|jgi:UDP:flavonoid glycosyltransferase YjiC (YdhE family)|nr:nucleotide disphospho-sugar-binding domain-containing protein [Gammaproteobacteria bacterium]
MAKILMAWELGAGYGHLAPLLTLARPLKAAGHEVSFVVRDVVAAEAVLAGSGIPFYPAPANFSPSGAVTLHSYPQILLSTAFNHADEVRARVRAWRSLFEMLKPAVLVADHAPTALLAARGGPMRCVITGNGFVLPPDVSPLPELRPWAPADPKLLADAEAQALQQMNDVARRLGAPLFTRVADLYAGTAPALFTFPELDNYAALRAGADYWGVLPGPGGAAPRWPAGSGKRVFFYGQPFPSLAGVLESLAGAAHRTLVYIPKLAPELRRFAGPRLVFAGTLQDMAAVTRDCDAAVMTSGHSTVAAMLLAGKPVVVLPQHLEMFLIARGIEESGAGLAAPALKREGILRKLARVLDEPSFGEKARAIAQRHRDWDTASAVTKFTALVTRLAAER